MLTADAIEKIEELAQAAQKNITFHASANRVCVTDLRTGDIKWVPIPTLPPIIGCRRLDDLVHCAEEYGHDGDIWVSPKQAVVIFDSTRIGRATLPLCVNPAISVLQNLTSKTPQVLRRSLAVDLHGIETTPQDFKQVISAIKFEVTQATEAKLQRGDESLGKTLRSVTTSENDLPEEVSFTLSVYPDMAEVQTDVTIRCAVFTEPSTGTLSVIPFAGEIQRAIDNAVERIASYIEGSLPSAGVFCGDCQ